LLAWSCLFFDWIRLQDKPFKPTRPIHSLHSLRSPIHRLHNRQQNHSLNHPNMLSLWACITDH